MVLDTKKLFFIIYLVLLIAMPVCFASDNNTSADELYAVQTDDLDSNFNSTILKSSAEDNVLSSDGGYTHVYFDSSVASGGDGSISRPYKTISNAGNSITQKSVYHFANGYYEYNKNLLVRNDVQFIGEDSSNTIINLHEKVFRMSKYRGITPSLKLQNMTLLNTGIDGSSGNINCNKVIFENSTLDTSSTYGYSLGGAIFAGDSIILTNCIFKNSKADYGGAIYSVGNVYIENSTFTNYSANYDGGVIYSEGTVNIVSSRFESNSANEYGGAIYSINGVNIDKSTFIQNNANETGGVIYSNDEANIFNSYFFNNSASDESGVVHAEGKLNIINSSFTDNHALGGGVVNTANYNIYISNSNFTNNYASSFGGDICCSNSTNFTVINSNFKGSTSQVSAGSIYAINSVFSIYNSNFSDCMALFGGAICDLNSTSRLYNLRFTSNKAHKGGAVYKMHNSTLIQEVDFISNQAHDGGALYINNGDSIDLRQITFKENIADYGGAIYSFSKENVINFSDVEYISNSATVSPELYETYSINLTQTAGEYTIFKINNTSIDIPRKYDLREHNLLTEVKDQKAEGNCWAFAAIAALESCILKANGTAYDFSEQNLKNIMASFSDFGSEHYETNQGGTSFMSMGYFASWLGPIYDNEDIYASNVLSPQFNATTHIQNIISLPRTSYTDNNAIKLAILKYGAVVTSICYASQFLNEKNNAYITPANYQTNHAVTIVGWDDNYSKDNFLYTPEGDGAFIIRNSWGPSWGDEGYFYVSYYDRTIAGLNSLWSSFTFILNNTNHYDKNYQYEYQASYYRYFEKYSDIYVKNSYVAESDEIISAVSSYFDNICEFEVNIYVNNELKHTQKGNYSYGYYTIPLTKYIPVKADDTFDVVFKLSCLDNTAPHIYVFDYDYNNKIKKTGVSFYSINGKTWYDWSVINNCVVAIKTFTKFGRLNTTINVNGLDSNWEIGKSFDIKATVQNQYGELLNEGEIIFSIDNQNYTVNVVNGIASKSITFANAGNHTISILFHDDQYYYSSNVTQTIYIEKLHSTLNVNVNDIIYGEDLILNISVNNLATGNITIMVGDKEYVYSISNGFVMADIKGLNAKEYTLTINYSGDINYFANSITKSVTVNKKNTSLNVNAPNIIYGENLTIDITLSDSINDTVTVNVNESKYNITLFNGKGSINISNLNADKYLIDVVYSGNNNFNPVQSNTNVLVNRFIPNIKVNAENIIYGDKLVVNVDLGNSSIVNKATGFITLNINDNNYIENIVNGKAQFSIKDLDAGNYTISINYSGGDNFNQTKTTYEATINKKDTIITINTSDIIYDEDLIISIVLDEPVEDTALITINGTQYKTNITNGKGQISIKNLKADTYTINAQYAGNNNYNPTETSTKVLVNKKPTYINTNTSNIVYGDDAIINIYLSENINEQTTINLADKTYIVNLTQGKGQLIVQNMNAGNYTGTIHFKGNENLYESNTKFNITVNKKEPTITVSAENIVYGEDLIMNISFDYQLTGNISITLNDNIYNYPIINGLVTANIPDLNAGNYTLLISYSGDNNFLNKSTTYDITVYNKVTSMKITAPNIIYDEDLIVNVVLGDSINGTVNITLDENMYTVTLKNGVGSLNVTNLNAGNYTINAKFSGDNNFAPVKSGIDVTINKKQSTVKVITNDVYVGEELILNINVDYNAKGNISTIVNDIKYTFSVENGHSAIVIPNLPSGSYVIYVNYSGDNNFIESDANCTVNVNKKDINPSITGNNITYGEDYIMHLTLPDDATGFITVYVDSMKYEIISVDKINKLNIFNLYAGTHNILLSYSGDAMYLPANSSTTAYVSKKNVTVNSDYENIVFGDNLVLNFSLSESIDDTLSVNIDNENYIVKLTNGIGKLNISNLNAGTYLVTTTYDGNTNLNAYTLQLDVSVSQKNPKFNISANNISYGEDLIIEIQIDPLATGNISFTINGETYLVSPSNPIIKIPNLSADIYTINAMYYGDINFNMEQTSIDIDINKRITSINISTSNITYGDELIIDIRLSENIDANVTVNIEDNQYNTVLNNGVSSLTIPYLTTGDYIITVAYSGNDNLKESSNFTNVNVDKLKTTLHITGENINYGESLTLNAILGNLSDIAKHATGGISFYVNGETIKSNIVNASAKASIANLNPGNYTVKVLYSGDKNFSESETYYEFTVYRLEPTIIITSPDIVYGDNLVIDIDAPIDITNNISVSVNSQQYAVATVNGHAKIIVSNLNAGTYNITTYYFGDEIYYSSNNVSTVVVNKKDSLITVNAPNITYSEDLIANIELNEDIDDTIYVIIAGKLYKTNIINGKGKVTINEIGAGTYSIIAYYEGNNNLNPVNTTSIINITKKPITITANTSEITYGEDLIISAVLSESINGIANINIADKTYNITLTNGKGQLIVPNLNAGNYKSTIRFIGNNNLSESETTINAIVNKKASNIIATAENIIYGDNLTVNIKLEKTTTGTINVKINNENYSTTLINAMANVIIHNLNAGNYTLLINYSGDNNYLSNTTTYDITVYNKAIYMNITAPNTIYGEDLIIKVALDESINGNITINIDNKTYNTNVINGIGSINILNLNAGDYIINVKYSGNNNFAPAQSNINVTVNKQTININAKADEITCGEDLIINIVLNNAEISKKATGLITATINNNNHTTNINEGKAQINIKTLDAGNYTITVNYSGDKNFNTASTTINTIINKKNLLMTVNAPDITYSEDLTVNVELNETIDDIVYVVICGKSYKTNIVNGKGKVTINDIGAGTYSIIAYYEGSTNYAPINGLDIVNINKKSTSINISGNGSVYGNDLLLYVHVSDYASGNVSIIIDSKIYSVNLVDGEGISIISNLNAGNYSISAVYMGNNNLSVSQCSYQINVIKAIPYIEVNANDILIGESANINISIDGNETGVLTLTLSDGNQLITRNISISSNNITIPINDLNVGEYNIVMNYYGDNNYGGNSYSTSFNVVKRNVIINIDALTVKEGQNASINIYVANATGNIIVDVDNRKYNLTLVDNKAVLLLSELKVGTYDVNVTYDGDKYYSSNYNTTTLTVVYVLGINLDIISSYVGEDVIIEVSISSSSILSVQGSVIITIDGKTYTGDVVNNTAIKTISGLSAGDYVVDVKYVGDENHTNSSTTGNFTVSKISNINITYNIIGTHTGKDTLIKFNLPDDATGDVTVKIGDKTYLGLANKGDAYVILGKLDKGNYNLNVTYSGDEKYSTTTFTTDITIESDVIIEDSDIIKYYGGSERFKVRLTDYLGNVLSNVVVTITINGQIFTKTTNANGYASIPLKLNSGVYNVTTEYNGTVIYSNVTIRDTIITNDFTKIFKNKTQYCATFVDSKGNLLKNTEVELNINGVLYKRTTKENGIANMNINLNPGQYILTATNPVTGEKHTTLITVLSSIVENRDVKMYYKNGSQYKVTILGSDGKPVGAGVRVKFNINGVFYERNTNAGGIARMNVYLNPGSYTITAEYNGLRASNTIKVLSVLSAADLNMKYLDGSQFRVKLLNGHGKSFANQTVRFNINGVFYDRTTNEDGISRLNIKLMAGEYIITSTFNGLNVANKVTISS